MSDLSIGIIGNPGCAKSTILKELISLEKKVANRSEVTIAKQDIYFNFKGLRIKITNLPDVYSLGIGNKFTMDQKKVIDFIRKKEFNFLINVIDYIKLKKNLYLTLQLLEKELPIALVIDIGNLTTKRDVFISQKKLSEILGSIPILSISTKSKENIVHLKNFILKNKVVPRVVNIFDLYPEKIKKYYLDIKGFLSTNYKNVNNETAISLFEGSSDINSSNYEYSPNINIKKIGFNVENEFCQEPCLVLVNCRNNCIEKICKKVVQKQSIKYRSFSNAIDGILLNNFLGALLFLSTLYIIFVFSTNIGRVFQNLFSLVAELTLIDIPISIISKIYKLEWLILLIKSFGNALQTIFSFIPIIFFMHFFLLLLENSGYVARINVLTNKVMRFIGLSGNSFMPLILGIGCNVPAISGTNIIKNKSEKIITIMMIPFISCTARLSIYTLFCYIFFPSNTENVIFALYIIGMTIGVFTGLLINNRSNKINTDTNSISLPQYKMPRLKTIISMSMLRTKSFIFSSSKSIIIVFFIVHLLTYIKVPSNSDMQGIYNKEPIINKIGKHISPIFKPLGLKEKNWPAVVAITTGIFAKEAVVGTLFSLYSDQYQDFTASQEIDILSKYRKEFFNIYKKNSINFSENCSSKYDMGSDVIKNDQISNSLINNLSKNFDDKNSIVSYLIFILLYLPCISVFSIISSEVGRKWAIASSLWSTVCAYSISTIFYQGINCITNKVFHFYYLLSSIALLLFSALVMRYFCVFHLRLKK